MNEPKKKFRLQLTQSFIVLFIVMAIIGTVFCARAFAQPSPEQETKLSENNPENVSALKYALIASAAAFGLGAIGAGIAISHVGAAAMGAVAEKPQIAG